MLKLTYLFKILVLLWVATTVVFARRRSRVVDEESSDEDIELPRSTGSRSINDDDEDDDDADNTVRSKTKRSVNDAVYEFTIEHCVGEDCDPYGPSGKDKSGFEERGVMK